MRILVLSAVMLLAAGTAGAQVVVEPTPETAIVPDDNVLAGEVVQESVSGEVGVAPPEEISNYDLNYVRDDQPELANEAIPTPSEPVDRAPEAVEILNGTPVTTGVEVPGLEMPATR